MKLLILFMLLNIGVEWEKTYGGSQDDEGFCLIENSDSSYIVIGDTRSFGNGGSDIYVLKINKYGDTIWTKCYGENTDEFSYSIKKHGNGYVIAGYKYYTQGTDIYLIKIDPEGNILWEITAGDSSYEYIRDFEISQDGNLVLAGYKGLSPQNYDFYFAKIDTLGNFLWEKTYGGNLNDFGYSISKTENGYIGVGYTYSFGAGDADIYVIRIDENGDTLWTKRFGRENEDDAGFYISPTSDGNYVICGTSHWVLLGYEIVYMKITGNGNLLWRWYNGSLDNDFAWCIKETCDRGYVITGNFGTLVWLLKTDSLGTPMWSENYGGNGFETGYHIKQTTDSCYIIVGKTNSYGAGGNDIYVIKTTKDVKIKEKHHIKTDETKNYLIYNILGQRLKKLRTGIYIKFNSSGERERIILIKTK